ncbi:hypothetical protein M1D80_24400 [Phyllobacteriaceae bacterium JZ32]
MTQDEFNQICSAIAGNENSSDFPEIVTDTLRAAFQGEDEIVVIELPPAAPPPLVWKSSSISQDMFEWTGNLEDQSYACVVAFNKA